jgi:plasmid maintenance system antidote protein VapI
VLRELRLKPPGLTVTQAARALGVSRKTLSGILNGRRRKTLHVAKLSAA